MPTGYTAKLCEEDQSFEEFVMTCSRAMGAAIMLRDEPLGGEIPEFKPSTFYRDNLEKAKARLAELQAMSIEDAQAKAIEEYEAACERQREREEKAAAVRARLEAMLAKVEAWQPPTAEHEGLKSFMAEQLVETIRFDGSAYVTELPDLNGSEWLEKQIRDTHDAIGRYAGEWEKEIARTEGRNAWFKALRGSLSAGVSADRDGDE